MSRTYRCRHLPLPGKRSSMRAYKITDGARGYSWRRVHDDVRAQVVAEFGPCPEPTYRTVHCKGLTHKQYPRWVPNMTDYRPVTLPGRSMKTWEAWAWDHEVDRLEAETIVPVCAWHPYQAKPYAGSRKKWERVTANRGARRYTHQLLGSETINEDWEGHFPGRRDYFNWRDIY